MKKIILGIVVFLAIAVASGAGYYFFVFDDGHKNTRPPKDESGMSLPPVQFPMQGKSFIVPTSSSTKVVLDLISSTAKRDYPMSRFIDSDGVTNTTLVVQDDFATPIENKLQAVPLILTSNPLAQKYYLAVLEGDSLDHVASLPIGDMIQIQTVSREGSKVTVNYLVHDRTQGLTEAPKVPTTAIFDISSKQIVQAGRTPATEIYVETKTFTGDYKWQETVAADGKKTTPATPEVFTLLFDANRISLGTDCNTGGATFSAESGSSTKFTVDAIATTKMFCDSAQEKEYFAMIQQISDYTETANGELHFILKDKSKMTFVPKIKKLEFASSTPST